MPSKKQLRLLIDQYDALKRATSDDAKSQAVANVFANLGELSADFLNSPCKQVNLDSKVPGKRYFSFTSGPNAKRISRAVNSGLFDFSALRHLKKLRNGELETLSAAQRDRLLYTLTASCLCAIDLLKDGDQKTPATLFECLVGHLFSRSLGVNPRSEVEVLRLEEESSTLPTDYIFDLGAGKPKFHVPVKTSTRERVIQVFAHQRVLDGVYGLGKFHGILVCFAETKLDHKKREVIEICVPKQWSLYQRFIAQMRRFYYFDIPTKYAALTKADPPMAVASFGEFFGEAKALVAGKF